eukprot:SAG22_NODE_4038_length_1413_cov_1.021309_1_plen_204_part_10
MAGGAGLSLRCAGVAAIVALSLGVDVEFGGLFPLSGERCIEGIHAAVGVKMAIAAINAGPTDGPSTTEYPSLLPFRQFGNVPSAQGESFRINMSPVGYGETPDGSAAPLGTPYGVDTEGTKPTALFYTDKLLHAGVDALIGPLASETAELVSLLAKYDNTPVMSYFAPMAKLTSPEVKLDSFLRTYPSDRVITRAMVDFVHHHE